MPAREAGSPSPVYRLELVRSWLAGRRDLPLTARSIGSALRSAAAAGLLELPLPGSGATATRWEVLAELSAADLSLGRLAEAHTDAIAILAELDAAAPAGLWGVWAAEPPDSRVEARRYAGGWQLHGRKPWCSGATVIDRALVSAHSADGRRLFSIAVADAAPVDGTWQAVGMAASGSLAVDLTDVPAVAVGRPDAYLDRPGFWHGGAGVAACWYGGALGAGRTLLGAARDRDLGPHAMAHLGAVDAVLTGLAALLHTAATAIDEDPADRLGRAQARTRQLRIAVEAGATQVLDRVGRALGAAPLCLDPVHARRAADLPVYLRQSHAERDLAELGSITVEHASWAAP